MAGFINERTVKGSVRIGANRGGDRIIRLDRARGRLSIADFFKDQVDAEIEYKMRGLGEFLIDFLQSATPVDTGFARANWQISVGKRSTAIGHIQRLLYLNQYKAARKLPKLERFSIIPVPPRYMTGLTRLDKFSIKNGDTSIIVTNNVPYMMRLNYGHSKRAPSGFIQKAMMAARNEAGML